MDNVRITVQGDGYLDVTENDLIMTDNKYKSMLRTDPIPNQNTLGKVVKTVMFSQKKHN